MDVLVLRALLVSVCIGARCFWKLANSAVAQVRIMNASRLPATQGAGLTKQNANPKPRVLSQPQEFPRFPCSLSLGKTSCGLAKGLKWAFLQCGTFPAGPRTLNGVSGPSLAAVSLVPYPENKTAQAVQTGVYSLPTAATLVIWNPRAPGLRYEMQWLVV